MENYAHVNSSKNSKKVIFHQTLKEEDNIGKR